MATDAEITQVVRQQLNAILGLDITNSGDVTTARIAALRRAFDEAVLRQERIDARSDMFSVKTLGWVVAAAIGAAVTTLSGWFHLSIGPKP